MRKVMRVIGLTSEDSFAQPQQQEPSPDLAGFDELSPADLDDLIGKAFPLEPPVLQQKSSLDLSRLVDLTQLERDSLESLRSAAGPEPMEQEPVPTRLASVNLLSTSFTPLALSGSASSSQPLPAQQQSSGAGSAADRKDWTDAEDEEILRGVAEYGQKWRAIATRLPGRSDDAVRNRWKRLVRAQGGPDMFATSGEGGGNKRPPRQAWTEEEDQIIVEMVQQYGFKWGRIERRLAESATSVGRTPHAIRNRFYRLQQQQQQEMGGAAPGPVLPPL
eukprot:Transcript_20399.p1 GENE.Transcript_20399~~Transcript_20399.p1  ORF type:complete len:276 (-),score=98.00 Transcript_20399:335-1162(-)